MQPIALLRAMSFPKRLDPALKGLPCLWVPPVPHLLGPAGFCTQQSLQHLDLDGFSWGPSADDMSSFRTAQDHFSLDHCPVIGKGRNGTKEAMASSEGDAG